MRGLPLPSGDAPAPDAHGEEEGHAEEAGTEGVVALTPEAAAAGVTVTTVATLIVLPVLAGLVTRRGRE